MSFLSELSRRHIFKVTVAYAVIAWVLAQVASVVFPALQLPPWSVTFVIALLILCFPVAVFLAWAFEISPEGVQRTQRRASSPANGARPSPAGYFVTALVAGSLGASAFWLLSRDGQGTWLREQIIPQVEAALDVGDWEAAYALVTTAEARVGNGPELAELWPRLTWHTSIRSDPPGARVFRRAYDAQAVDWEDLGVTPLDDVRIPLGLSRLRLELDGYVPVERVIGGVTSPRLPGTDVPTADNPAIGLALIGVGDVKLDTAESLPEGKVRVPAWAEEIDGSAAAFRDFFLDRTEVTNADYKAFVDAGGYREPRYWDPVVREDGETVAWDEAMAGFIDTTGQPGPATWEAGDYPEGQADFPVNGVSWYEASAYARFMGQDLPTVYHWRRALVPATFPWQLPVSNLEGDGPRAAAENGAISYVAAHDLAGNVREWSATETNSGERLILGAGWMDGPYAVSIDTPTDPLNRSSSNGFRLAITRDTPAVAALAEAPVTPRGTASIDRRPVSDEVFEAYADRFRYAQSPLNASIEETDDTRLWSRQRVMLDAAYSDERVPLYLYLPTNGAPPHQTVVFWPGIGATGVRSIDDYPPMFDFLIKSGRAVAFPVYPDSFGRGDGVIGPWTMEDAYLDNTVIGVKDLRRAVDYLQTRADLDPEAIGYFGYSWGGINGPVVLTQEPRIEAAVLYVPSLPFEPIHPAADPVNALPRVETPVLTLNGEFDGMIAPENAEHFYELIGTAEPDKKQVMAPGGHSVPQEDLIRETLGWFDKYLGPTRGAGGG